MLNRFDYRLIRQFLLFATVAEEKSIRKAAKRLDMSQTPLASQLDELETRLKLKLIERGPRGIELTTAGEALLPEVHRFTAQAEVLNYLVKEIRENHRAAVTVAAVSEAMLGFVPMVREAVVEKNPGITVYTKEVDSAGIADEIASKTSALAIGHFRELHHRGVQSEVLLQEGLIAVVGTHHPLAGRTDATVKELAAEDWVLHARDVAPQFYDDMVEGCRKAGVSLRIRHLVSGSQRQISYAACGQGIALLPDFFACCLPPTVRSVKLTDVEPCVALSAAWNTSVTSAARDAVLEAARGVARREPWGSTGPCPHKGDARAPDKVWAARHCRAALFVASDGKRSRSLT